MIEEKLLSVAAQQAVDRLGLDEALYSRRQTVAFHQREAAQFRAAIAKAQHGLQGVVINPPSEADAAEADRKAAEAQAIVDELEAALAAQAAAQAAADEAKQAAEEAKQAAAEDAVIEAHRTLDVAVLARLGAVEDREAYRAAYDAAQAARAALQHAVAHRDQLAAGGAR